MILGRVVGTVVATRKDERLMGAKLLLVRSIDPRGKDEAAHMVAVDTVDAGLRTSIFLSANVDPSRAATVARHKAHAMSCCTLINKRPMAPTTAVAM